LIWANRPAGTRRGRRLHTGLADSKEIAEELVEKAVNALEGFDERADALRGIARYVVERRQ
jgi:geranylgeranyl diphosphate synthase type II